MKLLFWISGTTIFYTYLGYPAWLWLRGLWRRRPVLSATYTPLVSIVMVVRNEAEKLPAKMQNLLALQYPAQLREIIVVSDGSTDGTNEILSRYITDSQVRVILIASSQGKAAGLNDAIKVANGEVVVFTDARQKIEPMALRALMENFADATVGCASGELMLGDPEQGETGQGMGLYWRIEKKIREMESSSNSVVGATGAFYAVRRELLVPLPLETILDDVFTPMQVVRQGKRVIFDEQARAWDVADLGADREFTRKVRTLSGNYQLLQLAPWLLSGQNPILFEFVSHKLLRLIAPFVLAALLVASFVLSQPIYRIALVLQLAFYLLCIVAMTRLARGVLGRVADAALTFAVLNTAAVVAFTNFVTGRKAVWTR